jgi:V8-like Glu-specific endopeptidase
MEDIAMGICLQIVSNLRRCFAPGRKAWSALGSGTVLTVAILNASVPIPSPAGALPNATPFAGTPAVGALFTYGPRGLGDHFCTASVVDNPAVDLVLTAAHCVSGLKTSVVFIPDYHDGLAPHGIWSVVNVVADEKWQATESPDDDFAFLVVKRFGAGSNSLSSLTGGEQVGVNQPDPKTVRVVGYPDGEQRPISCRNAVFDFNPTQLQFDCGGYTAGTSGGPLIAATNPRTGLGVVIDVIGGFQQGGDTPQISYAAKFRSNLGTLYASAVAQAPSNAD